MFNLKTILERSVRIPSVCAALERVGPGHQELQAVPEGHEGEAEEEAEGAADVGHQGGGGVDQHLGHQGRAQK